MPTVGEQEYITRIAALERLNTTLADEVDRLRREYNEEIAEFNAGYQAAEQGLPNTAEPFDVKHDVWKCGYAWGKYPVLTAQVDRMRLVVDAAIEWKNYSLAESDNDELLEAIADYEAELAKSVKR